MSLPPLIDWFTRQFDESPILAVLIALGVLLVALVLVRTLYVRDLLGDAEGEADGN